MRITHVSHELPPYELAGTAIYTLNIAKAQTAAGHDVSVFARLQDPEIPAYRTHDESRDGLNIRFVNRADIEWAPLERSYRDDRMKKVFGEYAYELAISSTKSMTGHLLGAAGAVEAAVCILAMQNGIIPPTANYQTPDPDCDLDYVPNVARSGSLEAVMTNSLGFGGHNASLVFRKYRPRQ
jgi:hypothetical protein